MNNNRSNRLTRAALFMLMFFMIGVMVVALPDTSNAADPESTSPVQRATSASGVTPASTSPVRRATSGATPASTSPVQRAKRRA